jgi:putative ATPase
MLPLAERLRPRTLDDYMGQQHLVGPGGALRRVWENRYLPSLILWGPPGVGKTTLARLLAEGLERSFHVLSAVNAGVKDVRETLEQAKRGRFFSQPSPILFIDEIHRFSKSQQDSLLGAVEQGVVTLIGATTENPSFEVIPALLSRCQVYVLEPLGAEDLTRILHHAVQTDEGLSKRRFELRELDALFRFSGGDARKLLNALELVAGASIGDPVTVDNETVQAVISQNMAAYDKHGETHYDIASAFIKSLRGSDPQGAVYWLARMIEGGEDPLFIARRMVILASEDIGLANPNALLLAMQCFEATRAVGLPEARIILSQGAIYLATSPKSNSAYMAIEEALDLVRKTGDQPVPLHLRNAPTKLMKQLDYGKGYRYGHDFEGNFSPQQYLPDGIAGSVFYRPGNNPQEQAIKERLDKWWKT